MPKIAAENIEEHIRQQTTRILDVARDLFTRNGYRSTDLSGIAESIGLARNSLYRYFPSKDHILVAVMEREMMPYIDRTSALADEYPEPGTRIIAWLDLQMELATGPCHSMIRMLGDMGETSGDLRQQILSLHVPQRAVLELAVEELLAGTGRNPKVVSEMIAGMVLAAGGIAMKSSDTDAVITELKKSVESILAPGG